MARRVAEHNGTMDAVLADFLSEEGQWESLEQRAAALGRLREGGPENALAIDGMLLDHISQMRAAVESIESEHVRLHEIVANLTAPPYFPAVYLAPARVRGLRGAVVQTENDRRIVQLEADADTDKLLPGDEVLLSHERNCLFIKSAESQLPDRRSCQL